MSSRRPRLRKERPTGGVLVMPTEGMPEKRPQVRPPSMKVTREAFCNSKQYHRAKIIEEIVHTEASFLNQLHTLQDLYIKPIEESKLGIDKQTLESSFFPGINSLLMLHKNLYDQLLERTKKRGVALHLTQVSDIFLQMQDFMKIHSDFAPHHSEATEVIMDQYQNSAKFRKLIDSISQEPLYGITGLNSLRQAAVTRLPRYVLLFTELIKVTEVNSEEYRRLLQVRENYTKLTERVNQFIKDSTDSLKVLKLDKKLTGRRGVLLPSVMMNKPHTWKSKKLNQPLICSYCSAIVIPSKGAKECSECEVVVHDDCFPLMAATCGHGTLIERGRKFLQQYQMKHRCICVAGARKSLESKNQPATLVVFNDSMFIYYGKEESPKLISFIRWYSRTKGRNIKIEPLDDLCIQITAPRDNRIHYITFEEPEMATAVEEMLREASSTWLEEMKESLSQVNPVEEIPVSNSQVPVDIHHVNFRIDMTLPVQDFTAYVIEVNEPNRTSSILKRYSEFYSLHQSLRCIYQKKELPVIPGKFRLLSNSDPEFLQKRCTGLQKYLNELVQLEGMQDVAEFQQFIRSTLNTNGFVETANVKVSHESDDECDDDLTVPIHRVGRLTDSPPVASFHIGQMISDFDFDERNQQGRGTGLRVKKGENVVILEEDATGWVYCRSTDNRYGYVPSSFICKYNE